MDESRKLSRQGLGLAVLTSAFFNLVPHYAETQSGMIPNDGLGILQSFTKTDGYFADMIGARHGPDAERWKNDESSRDEWESYDRADWWKRGNGEGRI